MYCGGMSSKVPRVESSINSHVHTKLVVIGSAQPQGLSCAQRTRQLSVVVFDILVSTSNMQYFFEPLFFLFHTPEESQFSRNAMMSTTSQSKSANQRFRFLDLPTVRVPLYEMYMCDIADFVHRGFRLAAHGERAITTHW